MFIDGHKLISLGQNCHMFTLFKYRCHFTSLHLVKVFFIVYYLVIAPVFAFEIFSFSVEIIFRVAIRKVFMIN